MPDADALRTALVAMLGEHDAMLAAALTVVLAVSQPAALAASLPALLAHDHPLVRESAALAVNIAEPANTAALVRLADDRDPHVQATAKALLESSERASHVPGIAAETSAGAASNLLATTRDPHAAVDRDAFASLPTPERMLVLASIDLFADLEPEQLYDIATLATERTLAVGVDLCREGDPGEEVFVVIAGQGEIFTGAGATLHAVGRTRAGDCVGELAVLDEAPRSATVRASTAMRVLAIQGHAFRELMSRQPDLSNAVIAMITRRLRDATARAAR